MSEVLFSVSGSGHIFGRIFQFNYYLWLEWQPTFNQLPRKCLLVKKICFISRAVSILSTTLHLHQLNTADIAFSLHAQRMSSAQLRIEKFRKQNERTDDRCSRSIKVIVRRVLTQNCHQRNIYIKLCSHEQQTHTHTQTYVKEVLTVAV